MYVKVQVKREVRTSSSVTPCIVRRNTTGEKYTVTNSLPFALFIVFLNQSCYTSE